MPKIIFTSRYIKNPASSNAGKLIKYIGTREGVEKLGKHGLFSQTDEKINLDEVADEVSNHNGIV